MHTLILQHSSKSMAKRFKLILSLFSFQFCRSNQISSLPKSPSESTLFSPINPKLIDILNDPNAFPSPPPTTPNQCSSKIMPSTYNESETCKMTQKIHNYPDAYDSDDNAWPITPPKDHKKKTKKTRRKKKSSRGTMMSISSVDSGWFSSEELYEESSTENFDSSCEFGNPVMIRRKKRNGNVKVRRLRRYVSSNSLKSGGGGKSLVRKSSLFGQMMMMPCAEGKVKESFAVVKNSEDPYEDFKRSMKEMITEKQMFEAKDLEQLLQCFLSLNARHHHAVIVQAFSEIWETLFL